MITCRSLGTTGQFAGFMKFKEYGTTTVLTVPEFIGNGTGQADTNSDMEVDIFVSMSGGTSFTRLTIEQAIVEYKN
jgi:hypothetical protein